MYFHSWVALVRFPKNTALPLPILTDHGAFAVDLFFAISGFVICLVASKPGFSAGSFLIKRVFLLYPLWLVTLTMFAVFALAAVITPIHKRPLTFASAIRMMARNKSTAIFPLSSTKGRRS
jgi:peptidoglycan/LPS O-acetylase OafA/YrhL